MKKLTALVLLLLIFQFTEKINAQGDKMTKNKSTYQDTTKNDKLQQQNKPVITPEDSLQENKNRPGIEPGINQKTPNTNIKKDSDSDPVIRKGNNDMKSPKDSIPK